MKALLTGLVAFVFTAWPQAQSPPQSHTLSSTPASPSSTTPLLKQFLDGPMKGVDHIVFAARALNASDGHWYANFGYYAHDPNRKAYAERAKLYQFNLRNHQLTTLLADPTGGIRDPHISYDGSKVLFSYRPGGTEYYHLYELNLALPAPALESRHPHSSRLEESIETPTKRSSNNPLDQNLRQLTHGAYDDIEPAYLPDGGIVFVSSRCNRWVNCWLTQVAVLHRCEADGSNLRAISSNNEHDNTPWPLPDGRVLYTRWEYVDRSQVHFHHLWAANPDGTAQMTWFGNLHPGITMIDAKPIPRTDKIIASFSPGHGQREHDGVITIVDPKGGPDAKEFSRPISKSARYRDPWAFSEHSFLAASGNTLVIMDATGHAEELLRLPDADRAAKLECHEPRPITHRPREPVLESRVRPEESSGRMLLADVNHGRNMAGVKPGEIKKLLVLETLPMPVHYTGGMEPISYGGTFTLERILGTVPVEADGSAFFEVPAMRSVFFVALDANGMAVKRMQSFTSLQPGETLSCVGCHEHRSQTPRADFHSTLAVRTPPHRIEPISDVPDVFDFPRDIQPVLDALCTDCHGYQKTARGGPRAGRLLLTGDHGPVYSHSYYMLTIARLFADGRNQPKSNYAPKTLGSSASRLLELLDNTHHGVQASPHQRKLLRLWIESAAAYPGTYAALGTGMIGNYAENVQVNTDADWPSSKRAQKVIKDRCIQCHNHPARLLPQSLADERGVSFWQPSLDDPRLLTSRHIVFNLSRPERSIMLLAPLAKASGGWELCHSINGLQPTPVFTNTSDPDYQTLLGMVQAGQAFLTKHPRFDQPGFVPRIDWFREMRRYGLLPLYSKPEEVADVYAVEQDYWKSLWHHPTQTQPNASLSNPTPTTVLARQILNDPDLPLVLDKARSLLKTGLNAGGGYGEVWIRDLNTFIEVALQVNPVQPIRQALLTFFKFQRPNGDIPDGFIAKTKGNSSYKYRHSPLAPDLLAHKNTVETDQESSLVLAIHKFVSTTQDRSLLSEQIDGLSVTDRIDLALSYLLTDRFDPKHGLIWGATTADWGDVQPEHPWGVELDSSSHRTLDIYDNALLLSAIDAYLTLIPSLSGRVKHWRTVHDNLKTNIRKHLWDPTKQKFIPHIYLDKSPFPADFDESAISFHGGTAVAIEAGILSQSEVKQSLCLMLDNVRIAQASSIGLTLYPPYPKGFFKNAAMAPYSYQNGGDWCWFGGRMIQQLIHHGLVKEAYAQLKPMVERVRVHGDFYEWWSLDNQPRGSNHYRGSAGVLGKAIQDLLSWAEHQPH